MGLALAAAGEVPWLGAVAGSAQGVSFVPGPSLGGTSADRIQRWPVARPSTGAPDSEPRRATLASGTRSPLAAALAAVTALRPAWRRRPRLARRQVQGLQDAAVDISQLEERFKELQGMRARELRRELEALGLATKGRVDKESLLELLQSEGRRALTCGHQQPPAKDGNEEPKDKQLPEEVVKRMEELRAMKVRDLRRELQALGLRTEGRVDKESLLELLELQGPDALQNPPRQAEEPAGGQQQQQKQGPGKEKPKPPPVAAAPEEGERAVFPIYMKRAVGEYGAVNPDAKVITLDIEVGIVPVRFVLDTASYHSVLKADVASSLRAKDCGEPEWAKREAPGVGIRQVQIGKAWLGDGQLDCGEVEIAVVPGDIPAPVGTAGILGIDFLSLFDWDFDIENGKGHAATAPKSREAPLPFDVTDMVAVPLTKIRTPTGAELFACIIKVLGPGQKFDPDMPGCQALPDLASSQTMCNKLSVKNVAKSAEVAQEPAPKAKAKRGTGFGSELATPKKRPSKAEEMNLRFAIGDGPGGYAGVEARVSVGDTEAFEDLGLKDFATVILGPDILCRSRLVFSLRQRAMWLPRGFRDRKDASVDSIDVQVT